MTIADIHDILNFMTDREQGEYFSEEEKDLALHMAQLRELQKYFADDRSIQQGNVQLQYRQSQHIDDAINQFKHEMNAAITVNTGIIDLATLTPPQIALYITGVTFAPTSPTGKHREVPITTVQEHKARIKSAVYRGLPSAYMSQKKIYVYAPEPGTVYAEMILQPIKPSFTGNVTLNWSDSKTIDIIYVALQTLGINATDAALTQYAASKSNPQV